MYEVSFHRCPHGVVHHVNIWIRFNIWQPESVQDFLSSFSTIYQLLHILKPNKLHFVTEKCACAIFDIYFLLFLKSSNTFWVSFIFITTMIQPVLRYRTTVGRRTAGRDGQLHSTSDLELCISLHRIKRRRISRHKTNECARDDLTYRRPLTIEWWFALVFTTLYLH